MITMMMTMETEVVEPQQESSPVLGGAVGIVMYSASMFTNINSGEELAEDNQERHNNPHNPHQHNADLEVFVPDDIPLFVRDFRTGQEKGYPRIVAEVAIIFITIALFLLYPCLLYTSPSPRDRTRSRMPSSA
eukprot:TRINITY_DN3700_c0_g1_i1.p1 TRINITY_DN3700_c0_g1~~TRINITY_DN3700_c0_g1_i1.p1  ORF type:complete len:133 (+),score=39.97 TRINITY_DN3700_c0_g1_i1:275-673(+)